MQTCSDSGASGSSETPRLARWASSFCLAALSCASTSLSFELLLRLRRERPDDEDPPDFAALAPLHEPKTLLRSGAIPNGEKMMQAKQWGIRYGMQGHHAQSELS